MRATIIPVWNGDRAAHSSERGAGLAFFQYNMVNERTIIIMAFATLIIFREIVILRHRIYINIVADNLTFDKNIYNFADIKPVNFYKKNLPYISLISPFILNLFFKLLNFCRRLIKLSLSFF